MQTTIISRPRYQSGFCSNLNTVLNLLLYDYRVYVDWCLPASWEPRHEFHFPYGRPEDGNIWEHVFVPTCREPDPYEDSVECCGPHAPNDMFFAGKKLAPVVPLMQEHKWRNDMICKATKYIVPSEKLATEALPHLYDRNTLGIHYRHPAQRYERGGTTPPFRDYLDKADQFDHVYVATDYEPAATWFAHQGCIVRTDVLRSSSAGNRINTGAHTEVGWHFGRVKHAIDMMVDVYALASCGEVIGVPSNVMLSVASLGSPKITLIGV